VLPDERFVQYVRQLDLVKDDDLDVIQNRSKKRSREDDGKISDEDKMDEDEEDEEPAWQKLRQEVAESLGFAWSSHSDRRDSSLIAMFSAERTTR